MLVVLFRALGRWPLRVLHALGAMLGLLAYACSAEYRDRFDGTWTRARIDDPDARRRALREAGKTMLELPWVWMRPSAETQARVDVTGWDCVERARGEGKGLVFLTPHQGCFEITAQTYAARGGALTVLYSPPRQPAVRTLLEIARARAGLATAPATLGGVRQLARALRRGEAVGILPDQVPGTGEGVWAEFFGHPAYTMTLPARLQAMSGAPVLLAVGERRPRGAGYVVHFSDGPRLAADASALDWARAINHAMETLILARPDQYLWGYNRYKCPAGVVPPPDWTG